MWCAGALDELLSKIDRSIFRIHFNSVNVQKVTQIQYKLNHRSKDIIIKII